MKFEINRVKISVAIPRDSVAEVREAVCKTGAGVIGNYTYCTSSTKSLGTFKPNEKAKPYIGTVNKMEYVEEEKLEFVCDIDKVKNVLIALRKAHPYEEPGIDIYPILDEKYFTE